MKKLLVVALELAILLLVVGCAPANDAQFVRMHQTSGPIPVGLEKYDVVGWGTFVSRKFVGLDDGRPLGEGCTGGVWVNEVVLGGTWKTTNATQTGLGKRLLIYSIDKPEKFSQHSPVNIFAYYGRSDGRLWGGCRRPQ
jgi:hypothetical protein